MNMCKVYLQRRDSQELIFPPSNTPTDNFETISKPFSGTESFSMASKHLDSAVSSPPHTTSYSVYTSFGIASSNPTISPCLKVGPAAQIIECCLLDINSDIILDSIDDSPSVKAKHSTDQDPGILPRI